jgi:hypothetical protein
MSLPQKITRDHYHHLHLLSNELLLQNPSEDVEIRLHHLRLRRRGSDLLRRYLLRDGREVDLLIGGD